MCKTAGMQALDVLNTFIRRKDSEYRESTDKIKSMRTEQMKVWNKIFNDGFMVYCWIQWQKKFENY